MDPERMIADLSRPEAYSHGPGEVDLVQTHISWVFLAGELVFKVKKPVDYGFLDFTTLEKRKHFCEEEVRLNRRLAPEVYQGVVPVTQEEDGRFRVDGQGEVVDFAVKMGRLPEEGMMLARLARGEVGLETMDEIAALLVDFYGRAESGAEVAEFGRPEVIKGNTDENFDQTGDYVEVALSPERFETIQTYTDGFLAGERDLLARRIKGGFIRDCHGDLHMANICLGDKVYVFDCIEFNQRFRYSDVASDLGFLAMDLDFHQRPDLAGRLIETYVARSGDRELPRLVDFYKCYRAYVRGKIHCFTFDQPHVPAPAREEALDLARRYFDLAYKYAGGERRPRVLVFFGLMGSGKTTWAQAAGQRFSAPVISSDRVRKQRAGLAPGTRVWVPYGEGPYSPEMSREVYQAMREAAAKLAGAGLDVVLDGSYMKAEEREAVLEAAAGVGAEVTFVLTQAREETVLARLQGREEEDRSLSDGRREILAAQAQAFAPVEDLALARVVTLETDGSWEEVAARLWSALGL